METQITFFIISKDKKKTFKHLTNIFLLLKVAIMVLFFGIWFAQDYEYMSLVFHTVVTVSDGLKNIFRVGTSILYYKMSLLKDRAF